MKKILWLLQFLLIVLCTFPLAVLPHKFSLAFGGAMGSLVYHLWTSRRTIAIDNLKGAIERNAVHTGHDPASVIKENFRNLGRSFVEIIKIHYGLGEHIIRNIEIQGFEHFKNAYEKGRGIIFVTGHCGNWELLALACPLYATKINVVARPQNNPFLNRIIERTREKYGNTVVYKKGALKQILSALKRNEIVGILMDQSVVRTEGIVIDFLGKNAYTAKMPAIIARKTGSPVIPAFIRRVNERHTIEVGEEIELDPSDDYEQALLNNTIAFSRTIEEYIKKNPSEWLWMHRRWKPIRE